MIRLSHRRLVWAIASAGAIHIGVLGMPLVTSKTRDQRPLTEILYLDIDHIAEDQLETSDPSFNQTAEFSEIESPQPIAPDAVLPEAAQLEDPAALSDVAELVTPEIPSMELQASPDPIPVWEEPLDVADLDLETAAAARPVTEEISRQDNASDEIPLPSAASESGDLSFDNLRLDRPAPVMENQELQAPIRPMVRETIEPVASELQSPVAPPNQIVAALNVPEEISALIAVPPPNLQARPLLLPNQEPPQSALELDAVTIPESEFEGLSENEPTEVQRDSGDLEGTEQTRLVEPDQITHVAPPRSIDDTQFFRPRAPRPVTPEVIQAPIRHLERQTDPSLSAEAVEIVNPVSPIVAGLEVNAPLEPFDAEFPEVPAPELPQPPQSLVTQTPDIIRVPDQMAALEPIQKEKKEELSFESILETAENLTDLPVANQNPSPATQTADSTIEQVARANRPILQDAKLTASEIDAIRGQIERNWNPPTGGRYDDSPIVSVRLRLSPEGRIIDIGIVGGQRGTQSRGFRALADSTLRAVRLTGVIRNLPSGKYNEWREIIVHFDPERLVR